MKKLTYIFAMGLLLAACGGESNLDVVGMVASSSDKADSRFAQSMLYNQQHGVDTIHVADNAYHFYVMTDSHVDFSTNNLDQFIGSALPNLIPAEELNREYKVLPAFDEKKCIGCGRCYISCYDAAHQAIDWNEKKRKPELNDNCVGCHLCLNVCPVQGCITPGEIKWKVRDKDGNAVREAKDPSHIKFKKDAKKAKKLALKQQYD